eukprot:CAMPEP_0202366716 /NCGR_PEP_ID=MMETSP1126-20121109/17218_1 /ASSEMBLY_ACC=CAM_ASM_000457 /TAXON_ID=3047 /ORGANISM="Dunaliella tertiolecta, Strain CCMP1320" /LENGTH=217 /DNA_ID=CAMNT_0048961825 /DNA_START=26 /DNA_END=680 /DNA_ORIENTATION=+
MQAPQDVLTRVHFVLDIHRGDGGAIHQVYKKDKSLMASCTSLLPMVDRAVRDAPARPCSQAAVDMELILFCSVFQLWFAVLTSGLLLCCCSAERNDHKLILSAACMRLTPLQVEHEASVGALLLRQHAAGSLSFPKVPASQIHGAPIQWKTLVTLNQVKMDSTCSVNVSSSASMRRPRMSFTACRTSPPSSMMSMASPIESDKSLSFTHRPCMEAGT